MPSATPERELVARLLTRLPLFACVSSHRIGSALLRVFEAYYRIQRLTLHLAAFAQLRVSPTALAAEFPRWLFRLPAGFLVAA